MGNCTPRRAPWPPAGPDRFALKRAGQPLGHPTRGGAQVRELLIELRSGDVAKLFGFVTGARSERLNNLGSTVVTLQVNGNLAAD